MGHHVFHCRLRLYLQQNGRDRHRAVPVTRKTFFAQWSVFLKEIWTADVQEGARQSLDKCMAEVRDALEKVPLSELERSAICHLAELIKYRDNFGTTTMLPKDDTL